MCSPGTAVGTPASRLVNPPIKTLPPMTSFRGFTQSLHADVKMIQ